MRDFEYADERIGRKEMSFTIMSMMIGVGVLTLPRTVANVTRFSDGWLAILSAGLIAILLAYGLSCLTVRMAGDSYYRFASKTVTKPIAAFITFGISVYFILFCGYEMRAIASISKQYLFERTPVEFIACAFMLVVVYGVAGSRIGLIRLNALFLPLVIVITMLLLAFSVGNFRRDEIPPFLTTGFAGITAGTKEVIFSLLGFDVVLFYGVLLRQRKDAKTAVVTGVSVTVLLYLVIYIVCIGVFSQEALRNVMYPAIELAKEAKIPGEFFERFESIFFIIWIMTIYNTTCMALDIAGESIRSLFGAARSPVHPMIIAPIAYWIGMAPQNTAEFYKLGDYVSWIGTAVVIVLPLLVFALSFVRGVKSDA